MEPNDEIKQSYFRKSESYLSSTKLLLENNKLEEAVSMGYYSMYYSLLGLLFKVGVKCENHTASMILLKEVFNLDNSRIYQARKERIDKQYYVGFEIAKQDVIEMVKIAEEFDSELLDFTDRLDNDKIAGIRRKFKILTSNRH